MIARVDIHNHLFKIKHLSLNITINQIETFVYVNINQDRGKGELATSQRIVILKFYCSDKLLNYHSDITFIYNILTIYQSHS